MTPTNKLRFVKRWVDAPRLGENIKQQRMILQQWWVIIRNGQETPDGEWRDVPTED